MHKLKNVQRMLSSNDDLRMVKLRGFAKSDKMRILGDDLGITAGQFGIMAGHSVIS